MLQYYSVRQSCIFASLFYKIFNCLDINIETLSESQSFEIPFGSKINLPLDEIGYIIKEIYKSIIFDDCLSRNTMRVMNQLIISKKLSGYCFSPSSLYISINSKNIEIYKTNCSKKYKQQASEFILEFFNQGEPIAIGGSHANNLNKSVTIIPRYESKKFELSVSRFFYALIKDKNITVRLSFFEFFIFLFNILKSDIPIHDDTGTPIKIE